jgi:light-regulated signal transduction histidine kinase (bacteriophytochrome)
MVLSLTMMTATEIAFTDYVSVVDFANFIGHIFNILAFYFIYKAIVETGLVRPFDLLFHDLKKNEAELRMARDDYAMRLERSNRDLEDFASITSHDLQEPLRKIRTFGDRLNRKLAGSLDGDEAFELERMLDAAERMQAMIDSLLTYSRVNTKAKQPEPVDLNQVLETVLSDLVVRIDETGGKVNAGYLPVIQGDDLQMHQLFQNLVGNALKFHRPDVPPVVTISSEPFEDTGTGKKGVQIRVEDNGIGFNEKYLDQIFQPFQRLVGRSQFEGSGMGLAICRKIVERHGGTITAHSQPGEGTTFFIRFFEPVVDVTTLTTEDS